MLRWGYHADRHGPEWSDTAECLAERQLADRRLLGEPARSAPRPGRWTELPPDRPPRRSISRTGRSATRSTEAGRSTTTAQRRGSHDPATISRLRNSSPPSPPRSTRHFDPPHVAAPHSYDNWTPTSCSNALRFLLIGFLSDHNYVQAPGARATRTCSSTPSRTPNNQNPADPYDWSLRAEDTKACSSSTWARQASSVQLFTTEFNSVYSGPASSDQPGQRPVHRRLAG